MKERGRTVLALVLPNLDDYLFNLRPASLVSFILVLLIRTAGLLSLGGAAVDMVSGRRVWHRRQPRSMDMTDRISPPALLATSYCAEVPPAVDNPFCPGPS